jgi:hypothetical protein
MAPDSLQPSTDEWSRVSAVTSLVEVLARNVIGLHQLPDNEVPAWLDRLRVPSDWRVGRLADAANQPWRIAVRGAHPEGGWDGCETIAVYGFSGAVPIEVLTNNGDCTFALGPPTSEDGLLVHQSIFVESSRHSALEPDIADLSSVVLAAFITAMGSGF